MKLKFLLKIVRKQPVFFKLFQAMILDLITWREMTERMAVEFVCYP